jgi:hypothetical protein
MHRERDLLPQIRQGTVPQRPVEMQTRTTPTLCGTSETGVVFQLLRQTTDRSPRQTTIIETKDPAGHERSSRNDPDQDDRTLQRSTLHRNEEESQKCILEELPSRQVGQLQFRHGRLSQEAHNMDQQHAELTELSLTEKHGMPRPLGEQHE